MADLPAKFAAAEEVCCWVCGGPVTFKAYMTTWECEGCDVSGAKSDLNTPPYVGDTFAFTGFNAVHTERYIDHVKEHVPSP